MPSEKLLFTLKPSLPVAIIPAVLWSLIAAVFVSFFVGTWLIIFSFGILSYIILGTLVFMLMLAFRILNLKARKYLFYTSKAEFYEGFLNIVQRTVQYDKVTDCVLTRTVWDRLFGTGTIRLVTAGHMAGGYSGAYGLGGGIGIQYIQNPDEVYTKVQELLKKK